MSVSASDEQAAEELRQWLRENCDVRVAQMNVELERRYRLGSLDGCAGLSPEERRKALLLLKVRLLLIDLYFDVLEIEGLDALDFRRDHFIQTARLASRLAAASPAGAKVNVREFSDSECSEAKALVLELRQKWREQVAAEGNIHEAGFDDVRAWDPLDFRIDPINGRETDAWMNERCRVRRVAAAASMFDLDLPPVANQDVIYEAGLRDRLSFLRS